MRLSIAHTLTGLCFAALASLCGCEKPADEAPNTDRAAPAPGETADAPAPSEASYTFGVIAKSNSNQVFQAARTGAFDAARDLEEANPGVDIEIRWETPADEDAQQQAQRLSQLVATGADGIAVSCTSAELLTPAINDAVDAGVDVVTFDSDAPDSKRFAYYGIDDVEAGREIMRRLAEAMGGQGVVAVLGGNQAAPNLQARIEGVKEEAANHPGIEVKYVFYHTETAPDAAAKVQAEQQANADITGWAMVGGWPLFTTNALDGVHQVAKVVSVDHLPAQLQYVRDGQVQALIGQDCYGWGYESVMMLLDKVHKGETPDDVINTFEFQIVTPENVEDFEGTWDKWLAKN